jgi:UTP--glucose-1-phosphate uridylyltransferase
VDRPLIQYAVEEAKAAGIEQFIFVTGRGKAAIEDHFDHSYELHATLTERGRTRDLELIADLLPLPGQVAYIRQQHPNGLGHAVWCARHLAAGEPVAVLLADDMVMAAKPCLQQMVEEYARVGGNLVAVMDVPREQTHRYGVLATGKEEGRLVEVRGLVEKPKPEEAPSTLSVIGRYILQPEVFALIADQKPGAGGEVQLTDALARMIGHGPFHGYRFEGRRFDCGDKAGFIEATIAYALKHEVIGGKVRDILRHYAKQLDQ